MGSCKTFAPPPSTQELSYPIHGAFYLRGLDASFQQTPTLNNPNARLQGRVPKQWSRAEDVSRPKRTRKAAYNK